MEQYDSVSSNQYLEMKRSGLAIARTLWDIENKKTLTVDDYNWIKLWMNDVQKKEGLPPNEQSKNWLALHEDIMQLETVNVTYKDENGNIVKRDVEIKDVREILIDPKIVAKLKQWLMLSFTKKMWSVFHPVERTAILSFKTPIPTNYYDLSDEYWCRWMATGSTAVALGEKGAGKTSGTLLIAEKALRLSQQHPKIELNERYPRYPNAIATNIKMLEEYDKVKQFRTTGQMYLIFVDNALQKKHTLCILDEVTVAGGRRKTTMSKFMADLDKMDRLTRKLGVDMWYIWHLDSEIPKEFYSTCSFILSKQGSKEHKKMTAYANVEKSKSNKPVDVRGKDVYVDRTIDYVGNFPVPGTTLKYETYDIAPYDSDVRIQDLIKKLSSLEGMTFEEELQELRLYLTERLSKEPKEEEENVDNN